MEFTKENMGFYIFMRCKLGESAKLIHETLQTVCGDCACSYQTFCRWVKEFNEGKESLSDCPRPGRPKSCVSEQTIASIKKDIDEDPHISVRELSDTNGLSYGTFHTIITEHLRMKRVCARWIPHLLTVDQKREGVRCATILLNIFESHCPKRFPDIVTGDETWFLYFIIPSKGLNRMWVEGQGDRPVVLRPGFQSRKRMFTVFFNYSGPLAVDILPEDTTMTAIYYVQNVLSQVKSAINEQRPKVSTSRTLLLHDNAVIVVVAIVVVVVEVVAAVAVVLVIIVEKVQRPHYEGGRFYELGALGGLFGPRYESVFPTNNFGHTVPSFLQYRAQPHETILRHCSRKS
ncbi:transposase [Elysia marginata]|uniref:Transposase n=1 Tax=Elysia marginata TaxID=1093978 RepID=A0AAV4IY38_9GAST|nr:transposase [Elysia marginata]